MAGDSQGGYDRVNFFRCLTNHRRDVLVRTLDT